jgi:hypothetical protein
MPSNCPNPRIHKTLRVLWLLGAGLTNAPTTLANGQFEVPADCGDRAQFEASVRARMGSDAKALLESMDLSIERHPETYTLFMRVGAESRQLDDRNCEDLFRAAVVVAVALWVAPTPAPHQSNVVSPAPTPTPDPNPDKSVGLLKLRQLESTVSLPRGRIQVLPVHPPRSFPQLRLSGELGLSRGLQPKFSPAFGLRGSLEFESFGVASTLRFLPPNADRDANSRGVRVMAVGGHVTGYFKPVSRLGLGAGVSTYYLQGKGIGSDSTSTASVVSFGPLLGLWVILWQGDSVFVSLGAEGQWELLRPRFEILGYDEVFRASSLVWGSNLAAGYRFN